jgi:hypothetical protein
MMKVLKLSREGSIFFVFRNLKLILNVVFLLGFSASETGSDDVTHSYVQYVEGTAEQTIYTTTNGQM